MRLKVDAMDEIENDPTSNNIISPDVDSAAEGVSVDVEDSIVEALIDAEGDNEEFPESFVEEDEFGNHEISALSRQLDQLQSALDVIESRNENIHKELLEILFSNREVRKTISAEIQTTNSEPATTTAPSGLAAAPEGVMHSEINDIEGQSNELNNDTMALLKLVKSVTEGIDKL